MNIERVAKKIKPETTYPNSNDLMTLTNQGKQPDNKTNRKNP
jgi:hypothetical protein